jgi:hypothetical protein
MIRYVTILVVVIFALVASAQSPPKPVQKPQDDDLKTSKHSGLPPKGEFIDNQTQSESLTERDSRRKREERFKNTYKTPIVDPGDKETQGLVVIRDYAEPPNPIPAARSDAVVIGTILGGKAFVSQDRTYVYSDYQVRVDQVLKQDATANLFVGGLLVASRGGGTIHFPSGHLQHFLNHGEGMPIAGAQYVLFLCKADPAVREYQIFVPGAYELRNGRVYALDDINPEYEDVSLPSFLDKVMKAIAGGSSDEFAGVRLSRCVEPA